ncbi:MAG TPA: RNA methyltransferase [Chloroflexia bacterium]|nr:RNA methyltransferase [Chloroflexia bacterium]
MNAPIITSAANPTIKRLRALGAPTSQQRRADRAFVVEGVRAVEEALLGGATPAVLLYEPETLRQTPRGTQVLGRVARLPVAQEASRAALAAAADTVQPQGILGIFAFPEWPAPARTAAAPLYLLLDGVRDPGNLGTLLRGAEAAGVTACWLAPDCVDLYNPKVVRAGAGVHFRLPCYIDQPWDAIRAAMQELGVAQVAALDARGLLPYYAADWRQPTALIVGNEAHGLSPAARQTATALVAIPMQGRAESLNAAMAATVVLFEALRQRTTQPPTAPSAP